MSDHGKPEGRYLGTELKTNFKILGGVDLVFRLTYYLFLPGGRYFYGDPQSNGFVVRNEADYEAAVARGAYGAGRYIIETNKIRLQSPGGTEVLSFRALEDGVEIEGTTYNYSADQNAK